MSNPIVTVLIDTYNHERFIEQAVVSALEQDFPASAMEILVVDDGSTDRTPEIVQKFEPRVRLIRKANGGQASALNVGIAQAQGSIVAFLDGDDWWTSDKLKEVVAAFEQNPGLGAVGHGFYEVDTDAPKKFLVLPQRACRLTLKDAAAVRAEHHLFHLLGTSKLAVRKEVLDRMGPIPDELVFVADAYIFYLATAMAQALVLEQPLCYYRVHGENLYRTNDLGRLRASFEMRTRFLNSVMPQLAKLGMKNDVLAAMAEPWQLESERFYLSRQGGSTWRTFKTEMLAVRWAYRQTTFGYKVFKAFVLTLTLVIPPKRFYQLKDWYAKKGLRRFRVKLGDAVPVEPVRVIRSSV